MSDSGRLTTHVLDTTHGRPAAGMKVALYRHEGQSATMLVETETNGDGRCDSPLLSGERLTAGQYELRFAVGAYFSTIDGLKGGFLDEVPVRFSIADPGAHYHVPLLVSPFGYSTYRGS